MIKRAVSKVRSSQHKKKIKILASIVCLIGLVGLLYYYPAPNAFDKSQALPIAIAITFFFAAVFTTLMVFISTKKALLVTLILTATLFIKHQRIISIIAYAVCIPLLVGSVKKQSIEGSEI
jgi:hypothetical protein